MLNLGEDKMRTWLLIVVFAVVCAWNSAVQASEVALVKIRGAIGPATVSYLTRAIQMAAKADDQCLIVELDTPGGLLDSTKDIVQLFYSSPVPVVVYVTPSGASATSAGCFITLAASVAAMAPNTSIGAAHPVSLGGGGVQQQDDVMKQKLENYAGSYIESIATKRGRNVEWAVSSVKESASITAEKALELKVVDLIANDVPELLKKLDGRSVDDKVLKTADAKVVEIPMIARERLFSLLWRPEVMLVLMLAAIYGIIGELSNPGAVLPGVVGGIALILALYMAAVLPVNVAGLALIGLALLLFVIDLFAPTHGVLTGGGVISFFLGALMLFDRADPAFRLSLAYIIPATLVTAAFFIFVAGSGLRAQRLPVRAGRETMLGQSVRALESIDAEHGRVFVEGEYWNAVSDSPIPAGGAATIVGVQGLTLKVSPTQTETTEAKGKS
jgi:membrane-bound serine protease (ClpP class)